MRFSIAILAAAVPFGAAIALLDSIAQTPELSVFNSFIKKFPRLQEALQNANNFTLLAPSDAVLKTYVSQNPDLDDLEATLTYHLLNGTYPDTDFKSQPAFPSTYLQNTSYTNITGGQRVQIAMDNGRAAVTSYNKTESFISTADIISAGGLMHIINNVLVYPKSLLNLGPQFSFFVTILTKGNFINTASDSFSTQILGMTDIMGFIPDSQSALDTFTGLVATGTQADLNGVFKYHLTQSQVTYSSGLVDGLKIKTLQGRNLTIHIGPDGTKYVNGLRIITTDYLMSNGVLHRIDGCLDPNNITSPVYATPTPSATPSPSATPPPKSSKGLSTGAKAGIAIGVLALVGLIAAGALLFLRRRKQSRAAPAQPFVGATKVHATGHNDAGSNWDWESQSKNSATELHGTTADYAMRPLPERPLVSSRNRNGPTKNIVHVSEYQAIQHPSFAVELEAARTRSPPVDGVSPTAQKPRQGSTPISPPD